MQGRNASAAGLKNFASDSEGKVAEGNISLFQALLCGLPPKNGEKHQVIQSRQSLKGCRAASSFIYSRCNQVDSQDQSSHCSYWGPKFSPQHGTHIGWFTTLCTFCTEESDTSFWPQQTHAMHTHVHTKTLRCIFILFWHDLPPPTHKSIVYQPGWFIKILLY